MGAVKYHAVNARGQIVIPAKLRDRLAIKKGTKVAFVEEKGRLFVQPITDSFIESMRGSLRRVPRRNDIEKRFP